ncbi:glycosyltransferase family 4 protein [Flavobacterium sp. ZB4R12]|uniref:glycosyltransferase family 4 protein n=1 Tax=Flavobacterium sp. ZB4R12 TaxID=3398732 RepID=UPI003AAD41E7
MNVLFDATWIGSNLNKNAMHGGLRVIYELTKKLENSNEVDLFYSINHYNKSLIKNLVSILEEDYELNSINKILNKQSELFRYEHFLNSKINSYLFKYLGLKETFKLNNFNNNKLRLIDVYHSPMEAIPNEIKNYKNIKRIFTSHDVMPFVRPDLAPKSFGNLLKPAYDSVDKDTNVICVSNFTKSELLSFRKDLVEDKIDVVYLGADKKLFFPNECQTQFSFIKSKYDLKFEKYLLCLNRNQKYKNTEHIIKAYIELILSEKISDLGIILIGTFENDELKRKFLNKYKTYKNIHFIEYVPDNELSVFYSNALCFLYMSLYEGFGLPVIEAMQCGTPVIASNQASLPEVIESAGICIDPFNVELLSDKINSIYKNHELANELSIRSLKRAKFFSWEKNLDETIKIYKKAINN